MTSQQGASATRVADVWLVAGAVDLERWARRVRQDHVVASSPAAGSLTAVEGSGSGAGREAGWARSEVTLTVGSELLSEGKESEECQAGSAVRCLCAVGAQRHGKTQGAAGGQGDVGVTGRNRTEEEGNSRAREGGTEKPLGALLALQGAESLRRWSPGDTVCSSPQTAPPAASAPTDRVTPAAHRSPCRWWSPCREPGSRGGWPR